MITTLKFLEESPRFEHETPYEMFGYPQIPAEQRSNCTYATFNDITLSDVRSSKAEFTLEESGFQFIRHKSRYRLSSDDFEIPGDNPNPVVGNYLEETMKKTQEELKASKVVCFDWRFRRSGFSLDEKVERTDARRLRAQALPAGLTMHCDYSREGGEARIKMHLTEEELEDYLKDKQRVKIVNAWRPLDVVFNAPLVISDKRTVPQCDLIEVDKVLPNLVEKAYYVKHRNYQRWYYMSEQTPHDLTLFTTWDSRQGSDVQVSDWSPHGAASYFLADDSKPRESLEVRMIVLLPQSKVA